MTSIEIFQDQWHNGPMIALGCALLVVTFFALSHVVKPAIDPREPPILEPRLPLVGHIVGLLQYGVDYFSFLGYAPSAHLKMSEAAMI